MGHPAWPRQARFQIASAVVAIAVLVLAEKSRLHTMVTRIDDAELRAGIRFAVMAVVILPPLPPGPNDDACDPRCGKIHGSSFPMSRSGPGIRLTWDTYAVSKDGWSAATPVGVVTVKLGAAELPGKAKIVLKGKGTNLPDMPLPLDTPVTVQLVRMLGTELECWEAIFANAKKNAGGQFVARE